jgi:hypothetical protein
MVGGPGELGRARRGDGQSGMKAKPWTSDDGSSAGLTFWCPGCDGWHQVWTKTARPGGGWGFNGDLVRPTFSPSVLVTYDGPDADGKDTGFGGGPPSRCHSFVRNGRIEFLPDCSHALANQTVELPEIESKRG